MKSEETVKLEREVALGAEYEMVYNNYIKPFIEEKEAVLFEQFKDTNVLKTDELQAIKLQATAIRSLASHFTSVIQTGKMARITLEK